MISIVQPLFWNEFKTATSFYNLAHGLCPNYQSIQSFCTETP
jgi:hypothetical protein